MSAQATTVPKLAGRIKWSTVGHYALLIFLALIIIFPGYMMLLTSLKRQVVIMSKEPVWMFTPSLANYEKTLEQENFLRHLISSIWKLRAN